MSPTADPFWSELAPDAAGLVTAVVQHADTGQVLMVGHMNQDALVATRATGRVTFWSRSRQSLWEKGETSGNTLELTALRVDCDGDAILISARPAGPTCHTGTTSCFFRAVPTDEAAPLSTDAQSVPFQCKIVLSSLETPEGSPRNRPPTAQTSFAPEPPTIP